MSFVLGLTGGIGCGKSAVTDCFSELGVKVIDADVLARDLTCVGSPALVQIRQYFGDSIVTADGELDRKQLRARVFAQAGDRQWLEQLLHPLIQTKVKTTLHAYREETYCILCAPLLLEGQLRHLCDRILVIDCTEATQIARASRRDKRPAEAIKRIMQQQLSRQQRLVKADDILLNESSLVELRATVEAYHSQLLDRIHKLRLANTEPKPML